MDDLAAFLRMVLEEDEQDIYTSGPLLEPRHWHAKHPRRVAREIDAKRRIVDAHDREHECLEFTASGASLVDGRPYELWELEHTADTGRSCYVLRELAAVYCDHPNYRSEWKPE